MTFFMSLTPFLDRHCPACPGNPFELQTKWVARMKRAMTNLRGREGRKTGGEAPENGV
jgi:hypothetical protein